VSAPRVTYVGAASLGLTSPSPCVSRAMDAPPALSLPDRARDIPTENRRAAVPGTVAAEPTDDRTASAVEVIDDRATDDRWPGSEPLDILAAEAREMLVRPRDFLPDVPPPVPLSAPSKTVPAVPYPYPYPCANPYVSVAVSLCPLLWPPTPCIPLTLPVPIAPTDGRTARSDGPLPPSAAAAAVAAVVAPPSTKEPCDALPTGTCCVPIPPVDDVRATLGGGAGSGA